MASSPNGAPCPQCGDVEFGRWKSCESCKRARRRGQVRTSQRQRRQEHPREAARGDRAADLWRRWRNGELLPVLLFHVVTRTAWAVTARRHDIIPVTPFILERVFPGFPTAFDAFPTSATLLVLTRCPLRLNDFPMVQCRTDHDAADVSLVLSVAPVMQVAAQHQVTEAFGGCPSCTSLMRTVNVTIEIASSATPAHVGNGNGRMPPIVDEQPATRGGGK